MAMAYSQASQKSGQAAFSNYVVQLWNQLSDDINCW